MVRQSYDVFQTYGKQPESLENITRAFGIVLHRFDDEAISEAFLQWMREKNTLPTPADILDICERKQAQSRHFDAETMAARDAAVREQQRLAQRRREELAAKPEMTEEDLREWLDAMKTAIAPERKKNIGPGKLDAAHWNSMADEMKKTLLAEAMIKIKTARHG